MHLADLITEMNGFCGVMSVFSSMRYMALGDNAAAGNIYAALAFIPLGFFFDAMDGAVARSRRTSSLMGQELDSLADLVLTIISSLITPLHIFFKKGLVLMIVYRSRSDSPPPAPLSPWASPRPSTT